MVERDQITGFTAPPSNEGWLGDTLVQSPMGGRTDLMTPPTLSTLNKPVKLGREAYWLAAVLLFGGITMSRQTSNAADELPVEGQSPSLDHASGWLNTKPLRAADLRGKVLLVDFWTYTCINWRRTLPWLRAWSVICLVTNGVRT